MSKQQKNSAFVKMLKEFPKVFGRVSFRERLMLRTAFDYINEEVIADIKANCDLAIEGRDVKIKELELELTVEKDQHQEEINLHLHAEDYIKSLEKENKELKAENETKDIQIKELQEQKCYWKDSSFDWRRKFFKLDKTKRLIKKDEQLNKAKEHIRTLISCLIDWVQEGDKDYCYIADAEQFLKEIEKWQ